MVSAFKDKPGSSDNWINVGSGNIEALARHVATVTQLTDWPNAMAVEQNALVYDGATVREASLQTSTRQSLLLEWRTVFDTGPGVLVIKNAFDDLAAIDDATVLFEQLIRQQHDSGVESGDHFAKPGTNDRVWNALEKHCLSDPESFVRYYANESIAMASEAWLGPGYQVTAQVNRVNPGGQAQQAHRDYHLGFMAAEQAAQFPPHVHALSPVLTLQGAVAHCDMPLETGPTLYLPYSHLYREGYVAFNRPEYQAFFKENHCQLPLQKGDLVFFNPALMHAAGSNVTKDRFRLANLLQVSSALGRSIESVDRTRMVETLYPYLLASKQNGELNAEQINRVVAASAEGYAFPTNLDTDPPIGGMAPPSQAGLMLDAIENDMDSGHFSAKIRQQYEKRRL